jgi:Rieske Fe-S protein
LDTSREQSQAAGRSLWPVGVVVGIFLVLIGIVWSWILAGIGVVLALACAFIWARQAARAGDLLDTGELHPEPEPEPEAPRRTPLEQDEHVGLKEEAPEKHTRRNVIIAAAATLGLSQVVGALATLPALGFMVLPPFLKQGFKDHDIGPLSDYLPEGQWLVVTFVAHPDAGVVSRLTTFVRYNGYLGNLPSYTVLSNHCAHLGCPVQAAAPLSKKTKQYKDVTLIPMESPPSGFGCPCHGGQYDTEGNRTAGPPVRALDRYSFSIRDGHLFLGKPFSVSKVVGTGADAKIHKDRLSFPGEPTGGIESWLYPIQPPS